MKLQSVFESMQGTGAITTASVAAPVGAALPASKPKKRKRKMIRRSIGIAESALVKFDTSTALLYQIEVLKEDEADHISTMVNSKIDHAQRQHTLADKNVAHQTSVFGLQDADGNVIKVTVKREEANDFEQRLNSILADGEQKEISEIIYMLKDDFDIVNVDWAEPITEDDPTPTKDDQLDDEVGGEEDSLGDDLDLPDDGEELGDDEEEDAPAVDSTSMQQSTVELLQQVVDMLKKETEVRSSEAELLSAQNRAATQEVENTAEEKELERQIELANVEEFEDKEREENKREKLVQRIARYRASLGQPGREPPTQLSAEPEVSTPPVAEPAPARTPPPGIQRRLQSKGF